MQGIEIDQRHKRKYHIRSYIMTEINGGNHNKIGDNGWDWGKYFGISKSIINFPAWDYWPTIIWSVAGRNCMVECSNLGGFEVNWRKIAVYRSGKHLRKSPIKAQYSCNSTISGAHHFVTTYLILEILLGTHHTSLILTAPCFTDEVTEYQSDHSDCLHPWS